MQKSSAFLQAPASAETNAGFTSPAATRPSPPVATFRQYLDGPAETFEMARREAQATARTKAGGSPDTEARRLFIR